MRLKQWLFPLVCGVLATLLTLVLALISPATAATAKHYTELTFPPLRELQIPNYTRFQLDNGMVVYLMEDHELPLVSGLALIRTGDRFEPGDQVGLGDVMADVMRSGGTRRHPADDLNLILEQKAASVETGVSTAAASASFSALSEDAPEVIGLFAEVLREPVFPQDKLDLAKTQRRGMIARRNDDPEVIAGREFQKLIYGAQSPYARTIEYSTLDKIARTDLVNFYQRYFYPDRMILGIVGDFNPQQMQSLIQEKFGNWQAKAQVPLPPLPAVTQVNKGKVFLVDQSQLTQSSILLGHLGGQLNNSDYPALSVLNGVLNGFSGRLFNQIRSRQGLAYSVYASWDAEFDYPGLFIAGGQTRSEATVPFIRSLLSEIERLRREPITAEELAYAKDSVLNSFVFNFQRPGQTLSRLLRYEYYNYPQDFIFRYRRGVEAATIADVQRVAQTYLRPEQITMLVVGNTQSIRPPLSELAPDKTVTPIDITIPKP